MALPQNRKQAIEFLTLAVSEKDAGSVSAALRLGAPVDALDPDGSCLMMLAAASSVECLEAFLAHGADPDMKDDCGTTALIWAAGAGQMQAVERLLARGADINHADNTGVTALMAAAEFSSAADVERLLARGADVFPKNNKGLSALEIARENGQEETVTALIEAAEQRARAARLAARQAVLRGKSVKLKPGGPHVS